MKIKEKPYIQLFSNLQADEWKVYPRPQMKRARWQSLNGIWKIREKEGEKSIRIPFPPQAELSGYEIPSVLMVPEELLYEKTFRLDKDLRKNKGDRILLHFGAVDQVADVFVNGKPVCHHEGGYLPFSVDITDCLYEGESDNILNVLAIDRLDHLYPWGKQKLKHGGMWYTPVSGIWQSVWLESVPKLHIKGIKVNAPMSGEVKVSLEIDPGNRTGAVKLPESTLISYRVHLPQQDLIGSSRKADFSFRFPEVRLWSPEDPYLYRMEIACGDDWIETYFGVRSISIEDCREGDRNIKRIFLNGKPILLKGVLDQGYFCDGLFLPAAPEGYEQDICGMKRLGFNLLRKHIKVEPELFYYACDRLGMLVMQDMVNNGGYSFLRDTALPTIGVQKLPERSYDKGPLRERARKEFFLRHSRETIDHLYNHPSVVAYTVFNEGWGQFASDKVGEELRSCDPDRLYDFTSGWFAGEASDFESIHNYFAPKTLKSHEKALLLSECGGYQQMLADHSYRPEKSYGYGKADDQGSLMERITKLYETMIYPSIPEGLCGFIYTQVSDIEEEVNGFYTYDRMVCKVDEEAMRRLNEKACL